MFKIGRTVEIIIKAKHKCRIKINLMTFVSHKNIVLGFWLKKISLLRGVHIGIIRICRKIIRGTRTLKDRIVLILGARMEDCRMEGIRILRN